ncbi:GPI biosynthesis family Pig-F protein [Ceratobasidium theobromae]|uniref:GPI biosynthesis family Pig-F protein n=1 Tax=Ceratobasidium theobromae TaxID=1582974 RepID=A0A5N5QAU7_9AGAM|nr:GPI biosynthesis family Pig-F protein [Ceratobasidium theobromae]
MLPRTRVLQYELANLFGSHSEAPKTSQDHPQHPFFDPLTDSPARTLFWLCIGSLVLVSWSAGSLRIWHNASVMTQNEPRSRPVTSSDEKSSATAKAKPPPTPARILAMRDSFIAMGFAWPGIVAILLLFGAPLNSHIIPTSLLALLISILTVWTPAFTFGLPSIASQTLKDEEHRQKWIELFVELSTRSPIDRAVVFPSIGAIIGCWLGALPMPLDWDRPWQAWPLTAAYLAIIGHVIGSGISLAVSIAQFLLIEAQAERDA